MFKVCKKLIVVCMLAVVLISGGKECGVFAGTSSDWKYVTVYGHDYKFNSCMQERYFVSGNTVEAIAEARIADNRVIYAGYIGAQARLYTEEGYLKHSSEMVYNDVTVDVYAYSDATSDSGYFYSQSRVCFYNGNGYDYFTAYRSPNLAVPASLVNLEYERNDNNETFGSGLLTELLGVEPDYIAAIGIDGTKGYIRTNELYTVPTSPEEAIATMQQERKDKTIPLYDIDGNIIGSFMVTVVVQESLSE